MCFSPKYYWCNLKKYDFPEIIIFHLATKKTADLKIILQIYSLTVFNQKY